ncbi:MAG: MarR family transcriptional regulator [Bacilli bacterium]|nr:MarR family transcriptional regulator [Bacilli bacterium]
MENKTTPTKKTTTKLTDAEKLKLQKAKEKEKEKARLAKEKEKAKEKERLAKEKEKEKARLAKEKEKAKEKERLAKEKEKAKEKERLAKEKEAASKNVPAKEPAKKAAPKKPLSEKDSISQAKKQLTGQKNIVIFNKGKVIQQQPEEKPKTPAKKTKTPKVAPKVQEVKPLPKKKVKTFTKEEKLMYKKLGEYFDYIANLTMVIEEKTMDKKGIPDLTIGELHVVQKVDEMNNQPMTKIADALKVTVGSLTIGVNRLIQKEYIDRIRDEKDHRIVRLVITQKGKRVLKFHDKFHEDILMSVLDGVTIRDATKVLAQFTRVLENYISVYNSTKEGGETNDKRSTTSRKA